MLCYSFIFNSPLYPAYAVPCVSLQLASLPMHCFILPDIALPFLDGSMRDFANALPDNALRLLALPSLFVATQYSSLPLRDQS